MGGDVPVTVYLWKVKMVLGMCIKYPFESIRTIAEKAGISANVVYTWLSGRSQPYILRSPLVNEEEKAKIQELLEMAREIHSTKRVPSKRHSKDTVLAAYLLLIAGENLQDTARKVGVPTSLVHYWLNRSRADSELEKARELAYRAYYGRKADEFRELRK